MVWMSSKTGADYLIIGNQMLWFGSQLPDSLLNSNQIRAFGVDVNDNPCDTDLELGIQCNGAFIPCKMKGTVIYFESRVPMDWEIRHLPTRFITGDTRNPHEEDIYPSGSSHESMEMQMVQSLTSGMMQRQVHSLQANEGKATVKLHGEVEHELGNISPVYNVQSFCKCMLGAVNVATTYRRDIDEKWNASSIITSNRHSKVTPEELSCKWNIVFKLPRTLYRP
jgi:hypothetical protein